jgi:hypothetical protein
VAISGNSKAYLIERLPRPDFARLGGLIVARNDTTDLCYYFLGPIDIVVPEARAMSLPFESVTVISAMPRLRPA